MALIIKGDIPSCCAVCCDCNSANDGNFCNRTGNRLGNDWQLCRPLNCPIIGEMIPDIHGRLVDADKLAKEFDGHGLFIEEEVKKIIDFFPAVVEASR